MPASGTPSIGLRIAAWSTHLFTATGVVCAFFAIVNIAEHQFTSAFLWLIIALFVDGIDGTFARLFKVSQVLSHVSGKTIDYVIDFANYALVPGYLLYEAGHTTANGYEYLLPDGWREVAVIVLLLVSALYYGLEGMVDEGLHFIGFPVLWNVAAFYIYYVFNASPWINFGLVMLFAVAHFIPLKYPYPSRTRKFMIPNILATLGGFVANGMIVYHGENPNRPQWIIWLSAAAAGYFILITVLYNLNEDLTTRKPGK